MRNKLRQKEESGASMARVSLKKDIPSSDIESSKPINTVNQELLKKKQQIDKLNKEVNNLIEESHSKYLAYEEKIADLDLKYKQLNSKHV